MIDPDTFMKNSPFQVTHLEDGTFNLNNTTPDLLKFQLQEEYRNKLRDLKNNHVDLPNLTLLNSLFLEGSFNNHLQSSIDTTLPSLSSTPSSDDEEQISYPAISQPNYLNLKILIENSVFDTSKINKDSILSLPSFKNLKQLIKDKQDLKQYLLSRINLSQQFTQSLILNPESEVNVDTSLLIKVLKLNNSLQDQLLNITQELDYLNSRLNNHNLACLVLGYVEDVKATSKSDIAKPDASTPTKGSSKLSTIANQGENVSQHFEELFSHIVNIAAKRDIPLPAPPIDSTLTSKVKWAEDCIDAVLHASSSIGIEPATPVREKSTNDPNELLNEASFLSASPYKSYSSSTEKVIAEYKTALADLRFSHHYLMKEYEHSRENSVKLIQDYRKKNTFLEKELNKFKGEDAVSLNVPGSPLSGNAAGQESYYDSITLKDKEIAKLRKELNVLKVDKLGLKNISAPSRVTSPSLLNSLSPVSSPKENESYEGTNTNEDETDSQLFGSAFTTTRSSFGNSTTSNGMLRKEFKKMVSDIQDQYEIELSEERLKRRQLQDQLLKLQKTEP